MSERFRDPGISWYGLLDDEILVHCPRCDGRALILLREGGEGREGPGEREGREGREGGEGGTERGLFAPRRLLCPACGHGRDWDGDRIGRYDDPEDPYFRLPLWLRARCCGGRTLWAYGRRHLDLLEEYVAARHRERPLPSGASGRAGTLVASLPAWIKNAGNRGEILRAVARMRATLGDP
ncbi:hypothetical protein [Streptosporangium sp. NPDC051022]|uniref:hypothetical protein n=1 Tax=Streptosporangium sp. NPDC051022 TaxID=3155752 RepID=UPI003417C48C